MTTQLKTCFLSGGQSVRADGRRTANRSSPSNTKQPYAGRTRVSSVSCQDSVTQQTTQNTSDRIEFFKTSRRSLLVAAPLFGAAAIQQPPAASAEGDFEVFYGEANPFAKPYSMMQSTGGCKKEIARYSFLYPTSWTEEAVGKIEKESNGTDCLFNSTPRFKQKLYVNSLVMDNFGGEDFSPEKMDGLLANFARIDTLIRDALDESPAIEKKISARNGSTWYDYEITGPQNYLMSITQRQGRVVGLFITAPPRSFAKDKDMLNQIRDSFTTYDA
ncbi:hypothetical protein CYMTET_47918 [Cymbomonas tetramitiformis]|uniref:PsbP C-terminal domain-containing protein n=1 Tax=Cymbomonas tetramitiformis TaxID=36881 RepID=A0AAE0EW57_9CHLO|nr:hypothetical protein CYMTET_47918 [Cymbomonas tetramitiformis]